MKYFQKTSGIQVTPQALEAWHHAPGAFQRLTPPWERMRIVEESAGIADGTRAVIEMKAGPFWTKWIAEHQDCCPGKSFSDIQVKGPFAHWKHLHQFQSATKNGCYLRDNIEYGLPMGILGNFFGGALVRRKLERTFKYRHAITKMDLERLAGKDDSEPMTILVTGATGMVGTALEAFLRMRGHEVRRVTRNPQRSNDVRWDVRAGELDLSRDANIDAVVHLAGENIEGGRWSTERKQRILESRRLGTRLLCEKLATLDCPPKVLVSASGANYYDQKTDMFQDETSPKGSGFLSDVCEAWESETALAESARVRVVRMRLGVVISPAGGALSKMLPAFQLGMAGRLGSGEQRMAWIALDDVVDIIHRAIQDERYRGALNAVAPHSPSNREFTKTLARVLSRPAVIPVPAAALRFILGKEMANETLLADLALSPAKLERLGYRFRFPKIGEALNFMLGRAGSSNHGKELPESVAAEDL
ncbi:TIGR01777 family oxidoreductase [Verrucomicrobiales bacterium]|nr:TIGR01777 family oxidoreductase [Verrucomicrobiales bacterium]